MSSTSTGDFNPYQSPASTARPPSAYGGIDLRLLKRFRREMHGLGGFWILFGGVVIAAYIGLGVMDRLKDLPFDVWIWISLAHATLYLLVGIGTCLKQIWAVWIGLILSYLSLPGAMMRLPLGVPGAPLVSIVILVIVIIQAHRCIKFAGQLTMAGVPLTAKPGDYAHSAAPGKY